jgi:hypothetical protein
MGPVTSSVATGWPPAKVPLRPSGSSTHPCWPHVSLRCKRETVGSVTTMSLSELRPIVAVLPGSKL